MGIKTSSRSIINTNCVLVTFGETTSAQLYLVGQVNHTEVGLQLKAERGQGRGTSFGPGELVEYDGVFRVQLFLLSVWRRE